MGPLSALAVGALTFASLASAGGSENFNTWATTTAAPAPSPEKVTWSVWVTDYETQYSTIYVTTTDYETKYSTIYSTVTTTEIGEPVTVTSITTEIGEPVTDTVTVAGPGSTGTVTVTAPGGTATVTVTGPGSTGTVTVTAPGGTVTVTAPGQPTTLVQTITSVAVTTEVQSCTTSTSLTGLVTCSSRIVNPTYTPTVQPPPNYLWGCRPGTVCKPKQEGCNFEAGDPASTYFCSPDECIPVPGIAPQPNYDNAPFDENCAWYTPQEDFFNLAPAIFGLDYGMFNTLNNTACTATATIVPPSALATAVISDTVTVTGVAQTITKTITNVAAYTTQPPPVVVTTVESQEYTYTLSQQTVVETSVVDITYTSQPPPVYKTNTYTYTSIAVAPAQTWQQWTSETVVASASAASSPGWSTWDGGKPQVTPRAVLEARQQEVLAPPKCYAGCNLANYAVQNDGKDAACNPTGQYALASSSAVACITANNKALQSSDVEARVITIFDVVKSYCANRGTTSAAPDLGSSSASSTTTPRPSSSASSAQPSSTTSVTTTTTTASSPSSTTQRSSTTAASPSSSSASSSPASANPDASQSSVLSSAIASVLSSTASQDVSQSSVLSSAIASVFRPGSTSTVTVTGTATSAAPVGTFTGAAVPLVGGHEARLNSWLAMLVSLVAMMFGF